MSVVQDADFDRVRPSSFTASLAIQVRVIGAVMLRELHTRFGRNNIGYMWLVLEPMILSAGISIFHVAAHLSLPFGFSPATFYASGYITYIVFRNNVNRASGMIESNKPLLFHKNVTLLDLSVARVLLDMIATMGAMILILGAYILVGLAPFPDRPWLILAGLALMSWLSLGFALLISGASQFSPIIERFVHPTTYLILPFSGMASVMDELPRKFAVINSWFPFPHIADLVREGLRADFHSTYMNLNYVVAMCAVTTLLGLLMLGLARSHMHFD